MRAQLARTALATGLLAAALAGCGARGPAAQLPSAQPAQTAVPTAQPAQTAAPTAQTAVPTAQPAQTAAPAPTPQPGAPTAPAARPTFAFEPRSGAPGTLVTVTGWDFTPNSWVGVFIGTPGPVGTALASAQADAAGRWQTQVTIPGTLPDGAPLPAQNISLVTLNDQLRPQASAPFAYQAPAPQAPPLSQAHDNVELLLVGYGVADIRPYLASKLRQHYDGGKTLPYLLGFDPLQMQARPEVGAPQLLPGGGIADVAVVVSLPGERQYYIFSTMVEDGYWKVLGAQHLRSEPVHQPFPGPGWTQQIEGDYSGDGVAEGYYVRAEMPAALVGFDDPYLSHNSRPTTGVLVGQVGPHNPNVLLSADSAGVRASGDTVLASFPEGAAGYLVALDRRGPFTIYLYPLRADGSALAEPLAIAWDVAADGFRLVAPPAGEARADT